MFEGGKVWVLDGGMGSTLQGNGHSIESDPLWSARLLSTNPSAVKEVHRSFLDAGADILLTCSYQASVQGFMQHLGATHDEALALVGSSVALAKDAAKEHSRALKDECEKRTLIAGSIGPYGACQGDGSEYNGDYVATVAAGDLRDWHRPRMEALTSAGVDLLALETVPALSEALVVIDLLREFPNVKAWLCLSCKDSKHTNHGENIGEAARQCYERSGGQLIGVGANCTPPHLITPLLQEIASARLPPPDVLPRVVYPDSGEKWVPGKGWEAREDSVGLGSVLGELAAWGDLGARVIGGCCRVGPRDIAEIAKVVRG